MLRHTLVVVSLVALSLLALVGCSTYLPDYYYLPRPGIVNVPPAATQPTTQPAEPPAMVFVATVVGVRRGDDWKHIPEAVEVRIHIENGKDAMTFDPRSLALKTGNFTPFTTPHVWPSAPLTLLPGQQLDVLAIFPFLPGFSTNSADLTTLDLRAHADIGARPIDTAIPFQRSFPIYYVEPYPYYDPYYGQPYIYGGGVYYRHWR